MAFDKYKDGAWMEPEDAVRRYDTAKATWVECDKAQRNKDGAWQEVWSAIDVMRVNACTLTNGNIDISDDKQKFSFDKFEDIGQQYGSLSGDGYIEFVIEGAWTNPKVSILWQGGTNFWDSTTTYCYGLVAGSVGMWAETSTGSRQTHGAVNIGEGHGGMSGMLLYDGTIDKTFSGNIARIGLKINVNAHTGTYYYGMSEICIHYIKINDEPIGFSPEAEAYSKYISDY